MPSVFDDLVGGRLRTRLASVTHRKDRWVCNRAGCSNEVPLLPELPDLVPLVGCGTIAWRLLSTLFCVCVSWLAERPRF